ncbi:unnamed protein product [Camellia sinensis]
MGTGIFGDRGSLGSRLDIDTNFGLCKGFLPQDTEDDAFENVFEILQVNKLDLPQNNLRTIAHEPSIYRDVYSSSENEKEEEDENEVNRSETEIKIASAISDYTLTHVGGAKNLMGSLNAHVPLDDAQEDPEDNAMPSTGQPQYWTDFLAMEQEWYNQCVQWEQEMANQFSALGTQFDVFAIFQNSLIQPFGEFRLDIERCHEMESNCMDQIEYDINDIY